MKAFKEIEKKHIQLKNARKLETKLLLNQS